MIEMKFLKFYIFIGFPLGPYSDQSVHLLFWLHHLHFGKTCLALNVGKYIKNVTAQNVTMPHFLFLLI